MNSVSISAYFNTARALFEERKLSESKKLFEEILKVNPKHLPSLLFIGRILMMDGHIEEALSFNQNAISIHPSDLNLQIQAGKFAMKIGNLEKAKAIFDSLTKDFPNVHQVFFQAGVCYRKLNKLEHAKSHYLQVLKLSPNHLQAANNLANIYQLNHQYDEALSLYDRLLDLGCGDSMVYANKAAVVYKKGDETLAEQLYQKAIELNPQNTLALYNLSLIANAKHEVEKSREYLDLALNFEPENVKLLSTKALLIHANGSKEEAKNQLLQLINANPHEEEPYLKLARIYVDELQFESAVNLLRPVLNFQRNSQELNYLIGIACDQLQLFEEAKTHLLTVTSHPKLALRALMTIQSIYSKCCEMDKYEEILSSISSALKRYLSSDISDVDIPVYNLAYYPYDQLLIERVLKKHADGLEARMSSLKKKLGFDYKIEKSNRLKIGYLSPNFRIHPDSQLIKDFFRYHDRSKFEIYAFSLQKSDDETRSFIKKESDHFIDLSDYSISDAAKRIHQSGIHILTCLSGYNLGMRMEIPALRPAPIQTMFMGYNESTQTSFIDYVFGDDITIDHLNETSFNEAIVQLPISYFANSKMESSEKLVTRKDYKIPDNVFVFGCLNHPRKFSHDIIITWAEILADVPNSILWLYSINEIAEINIRKTFQALSIDPDRILFCGKEPYKDHIRRFALIDLFLDTSVYNGHTTCLEALWMNIPVLTIKGDTVSSRLCASFLASLNLDEFICDDLTDYRAKAIELAKKREVIGHTKNYLKEAKSNKGILNVQGQVKKIEAAYDMMWERFSKGLEPTNLKIS